MSSIYEERARVFKAFCEENRLRIIELLQEGDQCACVLIAKMGIKQSALSYHMKILVDSGVVESNTVGKWTHYHISEAGSQYAQELLRTMTQQHVTPAAECGCACEKPDTQSIRNGVKIHGNA